MNSRRVVVGISAIVFAASAAMTIVGCASMSAMGEMEMPGGWTMSMMWMRMPGQSWLGAGASFVAMWVVMMVAMMLPSLTGTLLRYARSLGNGGTARAGRLTASVGIGYFAAWAVLGVMVFSVGSALAALAMQQPTLARAVPMVIGATVLGAGLLQQTNWKARQLALCREAAGHGLTSHVSARVALRHGLCLGFHCIQSCAGLTAVMLALGVMNFRVMAFVSAAITAERLAPNGERVARMIGAIVIAAGLCRIVVS